MNENTSNFCISYTPTFLEKVGWKLFPAKHCDMPEPHHHLMMRDGLVCRTEVQLSILDRLRVLVSGRVRVETKTTTENQIGWNATNAVGFVAAPFCLDPHAKKLSKQPENA